MKYIITIICMMMLGLTEMNAQAQTSLVKSIALEGSSLAVLELNGEVKVTAWDKDFIRITANIEVINNNEEILKKLVSVGRYDFKTVVENGKLIISTPKMSHLVTIKGVDLLEKMSFEVFVPQGFQTNVKKPASSGNAPSL